MYESIIRTQDIEQLVQDRTKENIYLEFKTKKDSRVPDLDEADARQFSRALSGFANSDGGVMVWGIETDKEECACKLKPISSVVDFVARLKKSLINSVQPFVNDVRIEHILESEGATSGYVKVLIPRSEKTPHRGMLAAREYYRRSTEGFYRLEHFDLEDAFGRRPRPVLAMFVELSSRPGDDPSEDLRIRIQNQGRGIARYVGCVCEFPIGVEIVALTAGFANVTDINQGRPVVTYADNVGVIHAHAVMRHLGQVTFKRPDKGAPLTLKSRWICDGMAEKVSEFTIAPKAIPQGTIYPTEILGAS